MSDTIGDAERVNYYPRATALARTFHGLAHMERQHPDCGIEPFDPEKLLKSARKYTTDATYQCAQFVCGVHSSNPYGKKFNVFEAWGRWDDEHRAAAIAWFKNPRTW